jgi:predicted GIY-YIG superfamily endonuclease
MARDYNFWIYIVTNEHDHEHCTDVQDAAAREKQLKRWSRTKNVALIATLNPRLEMSQRRST